MSLSLNFLGGAPFQLLYDGVRVAIGRASKFKTLLINLESTLDCLQPRVIQQIRDHNLELNLPNDVIQDLQVKMDDGVQLIANLSSLSMWNFRVWGDCCNCMKPSYADQLAALDRSLRRLLERLKLEQMRNVVELLDLSRRTNDRQDELERRQLEILKALKETGDMLRAHQVVMERIERNCGASSDRERGSAPAPAPALGAAFRMLFDVVITVKDKNMMYKRLLEDFESTLECLKPLIEELVESSKLLHLPNGKQEFFIMQMEKGVELIHKCAEVRNGGMRYKRYECTKELMRLDGCLQRLFIGLTEQVVWNVKEALVLVSNLEKEITQIEEGGVVHSDEIEIECPVPVPQPRSPSCVLSLQGSMDVQVEIEAVEHSTDSKGGGVEQIVDLKGKGHSSPVEHSTDSNIELVDSALKHARNIDSETEMFMQVPFPEECIGNIISLTTPADVCRLSLVSWSFRYAAESDQVWVNFLPSLIHTIQSQSTSSSTFVAAKSKKEIYLALCDNSVLMDNGKMSFSLDKWSGKKCYMICARELFIVWAQDKSSHWKWISLRESRFEEVASLVNVCWLEIRGKIDMSILSPWTLYKAYLVYKLTERHYGFNVPVEVAVCERHYGFEYGELDHALGGAENKQTVYLDPSLEILDGARRPNERADGWLEMELGEFLCQAEEDGEMEMICGEYKNLCWKSGLIVQGIEVRPERKEYTPTLKAMQEDHISEPKAKNQ